MKKWSEIKQATLHKLFLTENEASQQQYLEKFQYLANECLNVIANRVKPRIAEFKFRTLKSTIKGHAFQVINGVISYTDELGNIQNESPRYDVFYSDGRINYIYSDGVLREPTDDDKIYSVENIITLPDDFLSFADVINYVDNTPDPTIIYVPNRGIKVVRPGEYSVYYNALWEEITDTTDDRILNIEPSVLNCLPTYIAAQLLAQDDIQRSSILKNEFELLLAGLDTNVMYEANHYKSTGGWY